MAKPEKVLSAADHDVRLDGLGEHEGGSGVQLVNTNSFTGTISFECKSYGAPDIAGNWKAITVQRVETNTNVTSTTTEGVFRVIADGLMVRARVSAYTSGIMTAYPFAMRA